MTALTRFHCLIVFATSLAGATSGGESLLPEPRDIQALGGTVRLFAGTRLERNPDTVSASAVALVRNRLAGLPPGDASPPLVIGIRGDAAVAGLLEGVPEISGAYRILARPEKIVLAAHDARGSYYAALAFGRMLAKDGSLPALDLRDWPEIPNRGVVEGFYGTPWSHEKRLRLIRFLGEHRMDTYIYGPKDDPYHSSPKWREPYPEAEAARIRELAATAAEHHVDFHWAIHPGKDIRWNDEDYAKLLAKFESMHALGVRAFAVFFDDIAGEGTRPDRQADLLNRLHRDFVVKKGDVRPLVMCPTQYNKAWSGGDYLDILGSTLDPSIHVMWTGDTVVHDLHRGGMEWINAKLRRRAYIWWNFPVSDYVRDHLLMGPVYGNDPDIGPLYGGFVSNPMERAEASRVALAGVADYTWNPESYEPVASFRAAMREVLPGNPEAFDVFCRHNADPGRNFHNYRRDESAAFAPRAEAFLEALRRGETPDATAVRAELEAIATAPAKIRAASDNPLLIAEISPWLDAFAALGRAGGSALDAMDALAAERPEDAWPRLAAAHAALAEMERIDRTENRNPFQPGVKTASRVVTPMVRELVDVLDSRLIEKLSGQPVARITPVASGKERDSLPRMIDGDDSTFAYIQEVQQSGDWFGVELGAMVEVKRVRLLTGRNDDDHDRIHHGVLEGFDGSSWQTLARVETPQLDLTLDPPRRFRSLRVRIETPGSPAKHDLWTAIRSFEVNPKAVATLRTDIPAFAKLPVRGEGDAVSLAPLLEIHRMPAGSFLGLLFPEPTPIGTFAVDLEIAEPFRHLILEASLGESAWRALPATSEGTRLEARVDQEVLALRVRNTSGGPLNARLKSFSAARPPARATPTAAATDGKLGTFFQLDRRSTLPLPGGRGTEIVILASPAAEVTVSAELDGGASRVLGPLRAGIGRLPIPAGTTAITLESPQATAIHEVFCSTH